MNVPGWTVAAPRAKDVLHAVRMTPRPRLTRQIAARPSWGWFGAGLVLGAGLALLLTTTTGVGSRHEPVREEEAPRGAA